LTASGSIAAYALWSSIGWAIIALSLLAVAIAVKAKPPIDAIIKKKP